MSGHGSNDGWLKRRRAWGAAASRLGPASLAGVLLASTLTASAVAEPDTPVRYSAGSSATRANGLGFDTCTAPSLKGLRAWQSSRYDTVNVYIGGINRGCRQPLLDRSWVRQAANMGWALLPTYVGRQPYCVLGDRDMYEFSKAKARERGRIAARDAIEQAQKLGMLPGSALYADVEHYDRSKNDCQIAVRRYVSAWTETLHDAGYLAGVYVHHRSGLRDLSARYSSSHYARPDAIWLAKWDGNRSLNGWPSTSNAKWPVHQRVKQFRGDHHATYGGVTLNIDSNSLDAPVATVARGYRVTSSAPLNARRGPATSHSRGRRYSSGTNLSVVCQSRGQRIGATSVWNRLSNGLWVTDRYVSTPSGSGFSRALPRCTYPGQVNSSVGLNARTGPGMSYARTGPRLPEGALAWIACQKKGSSVQGHRVWNKLADGRWVSDYHVSTRSHSGWSKPIPRCR